MTLRHILLIDDHAMFRSGLRMVLMSEIPNISISEAGSVDDAISNAPASLNVVLLDMQMHGLSGLDGIGLLKDKWPLTPILILSSHEDAEAMHLVLERGADGFFSKGETANKMIDAINRILHDCPLTQRPTTKTTRPLTPRQREVLDLLYQGMSNKRIARQLLLSDNTIRRHVQDILEHFQVSNRAEAVFVARSQSLVG